MGRNVPGPHHVRRRVARDGAWHASAPASPPRTGTVKFHCGVAAPSQNRSMPRKRQQPPAVPLSENERADASASRAAAPFPITITCSRPPPRITRTARNGHLGVSISADENRRHRLVHPINAEQCFVCIFGNKVHTDRQACLGAAHNALRTVCVRPLDRVSRTLARGREEVAWDTPNAHLSCKSITCK